MLQDYRDTKIVSLAKKCRTLTVSLNKERGLNQSIKDKMESLVDDNERLKRELDLVSSPAARAAATRDTREAKGGATGGAKDSAQLQKQVHHEWILSCNPLSISNLRCFVAVIWLLACSWTT